MIKVADLPNGHELFVEDDEVGGRVYWSSEIGGGVVVWRTSLVDSSTVLAALVEQERFETQQRWKRKTDVNYCVNCRHHSGSGGVVMCVNPTVATSPVTGKIELRDAESVRGTHGACGPEGRLFEADMARMTSTAPNEGG